jgi:hypothetical protein
MMSVQIRQLTTTTPDFEAEFQRVLHWAAETDHAIETRVAEILADVRARGDAAVLEYTARFDGLNAASVAALELSPAELKAAFEAIPAAQREALQAAALRGGPITSASSRPAAVPGRTATRTAPCWARRSRRSTAWASTCPAARRPIPRRC